MENTVFSEDDIDKLSLPEAAKLARKYGIETQGLRKLKEIICKLKSKLVTDRRPRDEVISSLDSVAAENQELRKELHGIYGDVIELLKGVQGEDESNPLTEQLQRYYNDFLNTLLKEKGRLSGNTSRCPIMVLGETGAGKSSFINLLLGEEALPTQVLSNTNVICEIQYSSPDLYWALMYTDTKADDQPKRISDTNKSEFFKILADHIQKSDGTNTAKMDVKYKRAEIYLPCNILKTGLVIIDSPGIGDTQEMTQIVLDYIMEACSFIYIINSANAGGVQEDRVQELLSEVVHKAFQDQQDYRPECALFVCNKWDRVPIEERPEIWGDTVKKLTGSAGWPDCKESQIFRLSTTEAICVQKEGYLIGQFSDLLGEIHRLIPKSREILLVNSTRFLLSFLDKCMFYIDSRLPEGRMTEEDRRKQIEQRKAHYVSMKGKITDFYKEQKKSLKMKIYEISKDLSKYLGKKETIAEICDVEKYEKALRAKSWKDAMLMVRAELYTQITIQIKKWEKKSGLLDKASRAMGEDFHSNFPEFGTRMSLMEKKFQDGGNRTVLNVEDEPFIPHSIARRFDTLDMGFKVLVGVSMAPVFLLGAILRLPIYGFLELKRTITQLTLQSEFENSSRESEEERRGAVRRYAEIVLSTVVDPINLGHLMIKEVKPLFTYLKCQRMSFIKEVDADISIMEEAVKDTEKADTFRIKFAPYRARIEKFQGRGLYFFYIQLAKPHTKDCFSESEFTEGRRISDGCLTYIMEARSSDLRKTRGHGTVAIRHSNIPIDATNIQQVLGENKGYRFSTLVQMFGCVKSPTQISQVMEPLHCSLRNHITRPVSAMGKQHELHVLMEQVIQGLKYLHQRGYVHMDLSLDTVMVDRRGTVKLVNLHRPRKLPSSLFSYEATPVVRFVHWDGRLLDDPDNTVYTITHDMYSVGIMMYEMWTGHHAFQDEIEGSLRHLGHLICYLRDNDFNAFILLKREQRLLSSRYWVNTLENCLYGSIDTPDTWMTNMSDNDTVVYESNSQLVYEIAGICK